MGCWLRLQTQETTEPTTRRINVQSEKVFTFNLMLTLMTVIAREKMWPAGKK